MTIKFTGRLLGQGKRPVARTAARRQTQLIVQLIRNRRFTRLMPRGANYGIVKILYPVHFKHFHWLQERAKELGTDLTRDSSGLLEFVEEIGQVPEEISRLSVGRKDHSSGYVKGNYEWQDMSSNSSESAKRNCLTFNKEHTEETKIKMSKSRSGVAWTQARINSYIKRYGGI